MKTALLIVLLAVGLMVLCGGCVSVEDQAEIDSLMRDEKAAWSERIRAVDALLAEKKELVKLLKEKTREVRAAVDAGTLTVAQGQAFLADMRADVDDTISDVDKEADLIKERYKESRDRIANQIKDLQAKGNSKIDLVFAGLLSLITGGGTLGAVRLWRGGVNDRSGNIGLRELPPG